MQALKHTLAAMPAAQVSRYFGTAYFDGARWYANIHGSLIDARWGTSVMPLQGGLIAVDVIKDPAGLASAVVSMDYRDQPVPPTGVVLSQGVTEVVFTGADGGSYATDWFIGTYSPGDTVWLSWSGGKPSVIGLVATITQTPIVNPPTTEVPRGTGQTALVAKNASDTWSANGWGTWAKSVNGGEFVYSGSISGQTVTGAWFYGQPPPELAGKTITRIQFRFPERLSGVGGYNSPATVYVYAHTSTSRPSGDVNRVAGPHPVVIEPGSKGGFVDLPASFGPHLAAGGGISIAGGDYIGFNSRLKDPEAGKLLIDWNN